MTNPPTFSTTEATDSTGGTLGRSIRPADFGTLSSPAVIRSRKDRSGMLAVGAAIIGMILFFFALVFIYLFVR